MLESLYIQNVALIKKANVEFKEGLNIITGETGSGKSMLIDSINFMLGNKVSKNFLRKNEKIATVEGIFYIENNDTLQKLLDLGIEIEEDNKIFLKRTISEKGRSSVNINGKASTIGVLKEVSNSLVDIQLQHEYSKLLDNKKHITFLDMLCDKNIELIKKDLHTSYIEFKKIKKEIEKLEEEERSKNIKIDMLNFQIEELDMAKLVNGEEEELNARKKILQNGEKIKDNSLKALNLLYTSMENESAYDKTSQALSLIENIVMFDESKSSMLESLEEVQSLLYEIGREVSDYSDTLEYDENELNEIEERLILIYNLKRKYGSNIEEMLLFLKNAKEELEILTNSEIVLKELKEKYNNLYNKCLKYSNELHILRKEKSKVAEKSIEKTLWDLGMIESKFKISIKEKETFNENGKDEVVFKISTNKGEPFNEISKIASGEETSRILISIKVLLSEIDSRETFIFDEIDTGVSGRAAQMVGEKLSLIGKNHQILCITHLPQIASICNSHINIYKESNHIETQTFIRQMDYNEQINELARLIGGAKITDKTISAAKDMKKMAIEIKNKQ